MLPKIYIDYDGTYDEAIHSLIEKKHTKLAHAGGRLFASRLRKAVTPMLNRMLMAMESETGLSWKWPEIRCYVAHDIPFDYDNPMTIKVRNNMHDATETFFHELVHQLEMQNEHKIIMKNPIQLKYRREHRDTLDHVFAHAVLWKVYRKVYGQKKLDRIIAGYKLWPEHYRGWQIVKQEGADNIIRAYVKPAEPFHILKKAVEHKLAEGTKAKVLSKKTKPPKQKKPARSERNQLIIRHFKK